MSEQDFQTMKANILGPGERLKKLHASGQMSDGIYAKALLQRRGTLAFATVVALPEPIPPTASR